jgi:hypothetical protein
MSISLKTTKLLWGKSGNRCAICRSELIEEALDTDDDDSIVGDMAHIIARKEAFTRGDYDALSPEERDRYANLILLCRKHHKVIDDQPAHYTVERLREIKSSHVAWVRDSLGSIDSQKEHDEQEYAATIDEWCKRIDIDNWTARGTWICSADGPQITKEYHEALVALPPWLLSRLWPQRYQPLERSFFNFKAVLQDFLTVLNRHLYDPGKDCDFLATKRFYKISEWNAEKYEELYRHYDDHVCLVGNLFIELTRAANLVCDRVREHVFRGFRRKEGVILVQRDMVGGFKSESYRAVYSAERRTEHQPYKGLSEFLKIEYTGDYFLRPEHLQGAKEDDLE